MWGFNYILVLDYVLILDGILILVFFLGLYLNIFWLNSRLWGLFLVSSILFLGNLVVKFFIFIFLSVVIFIVLFERGEKKVKNIGKIIKRFILYFCFKIRNNILFINKLDLKIFIFLIFIIYMFKIIVNNMYDKYNINL